MTPSTATSSLARMRRIARGVLPALALAGGLVAMSAAKRAHADDHGAAPLRVASYNVQFVTPDLPLVRHLLREWPGHKPNVTARAEAIATRLACFDVVGPAGDHQRPEAAGDVRAAGERRPRVRQTLAPALRPHVRVRRRPGRGRTHRRGCRSSATSSRWPVGCPWLRSTATSTATPRKRTGSPPRASCTPAWRAPTMT